MALRALAINCTLKTSPTSSSCGLLLSQTMHELEKLGVTCEQIRAVDFNIKPGVTSDEGAGDEWPAIRKKVLDADILLLGTPIWLGHPASVCPNASMPFLARWMTSSAWCPTDGSPALPWLATRMALTT